MSPELNKVINEMAEDMKEAVDEIEKSIPTTRNHYGRYMAIIGMFDTKQKQNLVVLALVRAGANKDGVLDALSVINSTG